MRRFLTVLAGMALLLAASAPAVLAATEGGGGESSPATGSMDAVVYALVYGVVFGAVITVIAYRRVSFGEKAPHHEEAHDIREGMSEYEPGGKTGAPTGSA